MKHPRIYISGPISGRPRAEAHEHFLRAESELQRQGFRTSNPMRMRLCVWLADRGCYRLCLLIELVWLAYFCPFVFMLEGWRSSGGARTEKALAKALRKRIRYEKRLPAPTHVLSPSCMP